MSGVSGSPSATLNRRQLHKQQKLQQIDEVFYCECGKHYLTFAALYLHARNKHSVKLTTKRSEQVCRQEDRDGKKIITYFILKSEGAQQGFPQQAEAERRFIQGPREERNRSDRSTDDQTEERDAVETVSNYLKSGLLAESEWMVMIELGNYLHGIKNMPTMAGLAANHIPLLFNEFLMVFLPPKMPEGRIEEHQHATIRQILSKFHHWLRQNRLTSFNITVNQARQ